MKVVVAIHQYFDQYNSESSLLGVYSTKKKAKEEHKDWPYAVYYSVELDAPNKKNKRYQEMKRLK